MPSLSNFSLALKIAFRYVFSLKSLHYISIITFLSMLGISAGAASLIVITSVFNGFREFTEEQIAGFDPHLRIVSENGAYLKNTDSLLKVCSRFPQIKHTSEVLSGRCVAVRRKKMQVFNLKGADEDKLLSVSGLKKHIVMGSYPPIGEMNFPPIVLGGRLADGLNALPGDTITLLSPQIIESSILQMNLSPGIETKLTALFSSPSDEYNSSAGFCSKDLAAKLLKVSPDAVSYIALRLHDKKYTEELQSALTGLLGNDYKVISWKDMNKDLLDIMEFESMAAFAVLSLIVVIAAFNLLASLSLTVFEKVPDIAALRAMGAGKELIKMIFIAEGVTVGIISTIAGLVTGIGFCLGQMEYGWISLELLNLDPALYVIDAIPVSIDYFAVAATVIFTMGLSFAVTIYPAGRSVKTIIAEALRYE